jgi:hypothetical protein
MMVDNTSVELQAEIDRARECGKTMAVSEPRVIDAWYDKASKKVFVELNNDLTIGAPKERMAEVPFGPLPTGETMIGLDPLRAKESSRSHTLPENQCSCPESQHHPYSDWPNGSC